MAAETENMQQRLAVWNTLQEEGALPAWDALPTFGLYMDQVVTLLEQYFQFLPEGSEARGVSAAAINNYVRLKIMPAPIKRKYYRVHLAYLLMILPLKQSIGIADIPRILPNDAEEAAVQSAYEDFTANFRKSARFFNQQVHALARQYGDDSESAIRRLALESVLLSSFAGGLAGQLIGMLPSPAPDEKEKGKAKP